MPRPLLDMPLAQTPVAVLDFETTGSAAGFDRVVEATVVRVEPDGRQHIVFDSLIHPQREMGCTWVHGITDADVADAPTFEQVAPALRAALSGCCVTAWNASFDISFLRFEMERAGWDCSPPHACLMWMRPLLGLGKRCGLAAACASHGLVNRLAHSAAGDAMAAAGLVEIYRRAAAARGVSTWADLTRLKSYRFMSSWSAAPIPPIRRRPVCRLKPRWIGR